MGLYQPSPLDPGEFLKSKNYRVIQEFSKIFTDDFDMEIQTLAEKLDKSALIILSDLKDIDLDNKVRAHLLKTLLPIGAKWKRRPAGLKTFARLYRPEFRPLLSAIKFSKPEIALTI
jgi:hypothetical protein